MIALAKHIQEIIRASTYSYSQRATWSQKQRTHTS